MQEDREFKTILVTGGAGFIGSAFVRHLEKHYPRCLIRVIDKLTYAGGLEALESLVNETKVQILFWHDDIIDPEAVRKAMDGCDAVVNFAAESHVDRSIQSAAAFIDSNVKGTLILLEEAARIGLKRFVQVSTDEVYGDLHGSTDSSVESDKFHPRNPYSASKAAAEHLVQSFRHTHGLDVIITRGANTYGPWQFPEKIVPLFITNLLMGKKVPLYNDGLALRDYVYVDDHADAIDMALRSDSASGSVFNIGNRTEIAGITIAKMLLEIMNMDHDMIEFVEDRPGHDYRYSVDPTEIEIALGWQPTTEILGGLSSTVGWYEKNEAWWRKRRKC